jgi:hypothetical protein
MGKGALRAVPTILLNMTMVGTPTQHAFARPIGFAHPKIPVTNPIGFSVISI